MYCVILKCIVLYLICWRIPHTTDSLSLFSVCLSLCLLVSLSLYPFASLSLSFPLCFVPLPLCPSAYLPLWLLASLPPCLSLSPCLSVSLFLCLLVSLHCPYVFLSICVLFLCLVVSRPPSPLSSYQINRTSTSRFLDNPSNTTQRSRISWFPELSCQVAPHKSRWRLRKHGTNDNKAVNCSMDQTLRGWLLAD